MKPNEVYRVAEGTRVREEDFGLLLVSKTTPALALNDDMKAVWELIDGKNNCEQIVLGVKAQDPGSHVESKIAEIFDILVKIGLIQLVKEV